MSDSGISVLGDAEGNLVDEVARNLIRDLMANLVGWVRQIGKK